MCGQTASIARSRADDAKLYALTVMRVVETGQKHLLAIEDGNRESTQSWREALLELLAPDMNAPELGVGDGVLEFWVASDRMFPTMRHQHCRVHETANVLYELPKLAQPEVSRRCTRSVWM